MKYYFLKLKDDFFTSEKVIALESCPKGSTALLALIKMQSLSLKKDGVICMTENKGFSEMSLAAILHINKDDIQDVLSLLVDFEFISIASNKVITILDFENLVMSETKDAERKRAAREKKKQEQMQQQQQQPIHSKLITVDPTIENQSQSKSNNQSEEEQEEQEPVYDNQIALISCVEDVEDTEENSANFRAVVNSSVPPKAQNFYKADNVRPRPENVRQRLDIRDKRLDIRDKRVCNIISSKTKNIESFEEKILTHTQEQKLVDEFGNFALDCIKKFKAYCVAYNKKYQDAYFACRYWILQDLQKREMSRLSSGFKHAPIKDKYTERHYDKAFYDKLLTNSKAFLEG